MYRALGCKMVVGMPFKDIATADSIFLPTVPEVDDAAGRKVLKRLQDVQVCVGEKCNCRCLVVSLRRCLIVSLSLVSFSQSLIPSLSLRPCRLLSRLIAGSSDRANRGAAKEAPGQLRSSGAA